MSPRDTRAALGSSVTRFFSDFISRAASVEATARPALCQRRLIGASLLRLLWGESAYALVRQTISGARRPPPPWRDKRTPLLLTTWRLWRQFGPERTPPGAVGVTGPMNRSSGDPVGCWKTGRV